MLEGRHRRFTGGSVFHMYFRGLLSLLATQQKKWYHHLQQVVQSLIPHNVFTYITCKSIIDTTSKLRLLPLLQLL